MTKELNFKRCKTFIAMLLVLCQFFSIFSGIMPFKLEDAHAAEGGGYKTIYHNLRVYKIDQDGNPVEGANLQLINTNTGEVQKEWTTTQSPELAFSGTYEVRGNAIPLPNSYANAGGNQFNFVLRETSAPDGYEPAEDIDLSFINVFTQFYNIYFRNNIGYDDPYEWDEEAYAIDSAAMSEKLGFEVLKLNDWIYLNSDGPSYEFIILMVDEKTASEIIKPEDSNPDPNTELSTEFEKVDKGEDIVVTFENEIETKQSLTVSKVTKLEEINGTLTEWDFGDEFEFVVNFANLPAGHVITSSKGVEIIVAQDGTASDTITLKHGENVKYENVPVGATYKVTENMAENSPRFTPSYLVSGINVAKNSNTSLEYVDLATEFETIEPYEDAVVAFTNVRELKNSKLVVEKTVDGYDTGEDFEFTVTLEGPHFDNKTVTVEDVTFVNGVGTFTLKNGESKEFDIPEGTKYHVVETESSSYNTSYDKQVVDPYAVEPLAFDSRLYEISKVDENGNPVIGATLQIVEIETDGGVETGNEHVQYEWVSDGNPYKFSWLEIFDEYSIYDNSYHVLREVLAPEGYELAEDIVIDPDTEGTTYITMIDYKVGEPEPPTPGIGGTISADNYNIVTVTNTFKYGYLRVEKTVEGAATDEEFEFTVTLTGPEISGTQEFGGVTFVDGVGTFTLKHGEAKDFDLPTGTEYEVEEVKHDGYETSYEVEENDPYAVMPLNMEYYLTVHKVDEDNNYVEGATLQLINSNGLVIDEWTTANSGHEIWLWEDRPLGCVLHEVSAPGGYELAEDIVIDETNLEEDLDSPNDFAYKISMVDKKISEGETPEPDAPINPPEPTKVTGTIDRATCDVVKVTNKAKATLAVSKVAKEEHVDGSLTETISEQEFDFTVNFTGLGANNTITSTIGDVVADTNGNATVTFKLKHNETAQFYNLPIGAQYSVLEAGTEGYQASYLLSGLEVDTNAGNAEESAELATTNQLLQVGEQASVIFTNIQKYQGGKLIVKKKVVDAPENSNEKFEFIITLTGDKIGPEENFNGVDFINGEATITLGHGDEMVFDLPVGTQYEVYEVPNRNYETSYEIEKVNANAVMPTGSSGNYNPTLYIYKVDENNNPVEGATLQLWKENPLTGQDRLCEEWVTTAEPYSTSIMYSATVTYYIIKEVSVPDGYEKAEDLYLSYDYISTLEGFNGGDGKFDEFEFYMVDVKVPEVPYLAEGIIVRDIYDVVTVTNAYTARDITLKKVVSNPEVMAENEKFTIETTFENLEPMKTYELSNGATFTADADGNATYTARIAHNEEVVFKGIPVDAVYKFEEVAGVYIAGYDIVDKNK